MISLRRYTASDAPLWDAFVEGSKNGTFLFLRAYMDYHKDRFVDHSLVFVDEGNKVVALLPANEKDGELFSHQGLTYGGLILGAKAGTALVMECFARLVAYLDSNNISVLHYKQMPTIYHKAPSQDDDYALWRLGAEMEVCNIASTVELHPLTDVPVEKCRRRRCRQAGKYGFTIQWDAPLNEIWPIITESLECHHQASPVHSLSEMEQLRDALPQYIRTLLVKRDDGSNAAGAVLYVSDGVVHVQYAHATMQGYEEHVMDYLYFELMSYYANDGRVRFFDFGTSNERQGRYVNLPLVAQKEGFGGRGVAYRQWRLTCAVALEKAKEFEIKH